MSSPIEKLIDRSGMCCTICNARMGQCDCWIKCQHCHWSYRKGETCRNPECTSNKACVEGESR